MQFNNLRFLLFVTFSALFLGFFTSINFLVTPVSSPKDFIWLLPQWGVIYLVLWGVVYFIAYNKYLFAVGYPVLTLIAAAAAYFLYTTKSNINVVLLEAVLHSTAHERADFYSASLLIATLLPLVISIFLVRYRFRRIGITRNYIQTALAIALLSAVFYKYYKPIGERIPFNFFYAANRYFSERVDIQDVRPSLSEGVLCGKEQELTIVLTIGESLRADHLGLNGYERNTTPLLSEEDIISFPHINSVYYGTIQCLPYMMTRADTLHKERAYNERSFIDLFKACNYYTTWLSNQLHMASYAYFLHECDTVAYTNIEKTDYAYNSWLDEDLLPLYDDVLSKDDPKKLIVMQTIGSHWWYNIHYTPDFQKYNPVVKSKVISSNTTEEMINSYDNSILYTDFFLTSLIYRLRNKNALFIFLSDHGESLGEGGNWLHSGGKTSMSSPACFIWMSPEYKAHNLDKYENLCKNRDKEYDSGFLFHSIIDAAGIKSKYLEPDFSVFRSPRD